MSDAAQKNSKVRVVAFALFLSVICSLLITLSAVGLKERQLANMALDKKINILKAAGRINEKKPDPSEIKRLYDTYIQEIFVDRSGQITDLAQEKSLQLYFHKNQDTIVGYIIPINTQGLWGKIHGYLAFESDGQTVSGFSIFNHSETPGLGGEIESAWFRNNFKGKKIINTKHKFVSVKVAKGKVSDLPEQERAHYVDGISGATLTGKYLTQGIENILRTYDPVSIAFHQQGTHSEKPAAPTDGQHQ